MHDFSKLYAALRDIESASPSQLLDADFVATLVANTGLFNDGRDLYGVWSAYQSPRGKPATWQMPCEFSRLLIWLHDKNIRRVLDVGTFFAFSANLLQAYLRRFNDCVVVGCDPNNWPRPDSDVYVVKGTSEDCITADGYDLVFIDGEHTFAAVKKDVTNFVGSARFIALHDINDSYVPDVGAFWSELKIAHPGRCTEFIRKDGKKIFGIGVLEVAPQYRPIPHTSEVRSV